MVAIFSIISSISQLERDLIRDRVINGLRAAKERGVRIGRKKTRPSALIRRLRSKGLTYRKIAELSNCSQGSVALEIREWEKEKSEGVEKNIDKEIDSELVDLTEQLQVKDEEAKGDDDVPPTPVSVVRF